MPLTEKQIQGINIQFPYTYEDIKTLHDKLPPRFQNEANLKDLLSLGITNALNIAYWLK